MKRIKPTESELEILQILWHVGPSSVRFVNDQLNKIREVGYTTTLKLMQIMVEKGLAKRDTSGRSHIYQAAFKRQETQGFLLNEFLKAAYQGSAKGLVLQALGNHETTAEELEEIKQMIEHLETEKNKQS
jgi:predicted transcriptional regulator